MSGNEYGSIVEVATVNAGSLFSADEATGQTVLSLVDVTVFGEIGGKVYIDGAVYDYIAVDAAAGTMTLLSGLVADATTESRVEIFPPAPIRTAIVDFGVSESETVGVTIPATLSLPDGVRPEADREVALVEERNPGELYLRDIVNQGMTLLGAGVNLDDQTSIGNYIQRSSVDAASGTNYPVPYAGVLEVLITRPPDVAAQRYTAYRNDARIGPSAWVRTFVAAGWSAWEPLNDDTGWISTVSSVAVALTGWSILSASVRQVNKTVHVVFDVQRTGADLAAPDNKSNIADVTLLQMVSAYRPGTAPDQALSGVGNRLITAYMSAAGGLHLQAAGGTAVIATNDTIGVGGSYLLT